MGIFIPAAIAVASVWGIRRLAGVLRDEITDQETDEWLADDEPVHDSTSEPPAPTVLH